jgi:S1-C subfamily serine protease
MEDLLQVLSAERVGKSVEIRILRGGQVTQLPVRIDERGKEG